ncbi:MAG TPA: AAA family ATPase [Solirubrobacterales bacterium]|nr:AAA family ATPase [Solirubrobacterales bacterium]
MGPDHPTAYGPLLERERELAELDRALVETEAGGDGRALLIEGPAGIGKTSLLQQLDGRAGARGHRVLKATGSEMERDFGFGIVRQLFGPLLRALDPAGRARLFAGPVALAAAIFGLAEPGALDLSPTEASLYGLFWMVVGLTETGPLVISVDDAHWADVPSLRFLRYLAQRFDGVPVTAALAARPNEPGIQAETLQGLSSSLALHPIRPPLLSAAGTATIVRERVGDASSPPIEEACHEATGGNPLLIESLLAELAERGAGNGTISPERISTMGSERVGAGVLERAARLDARGPDVVRAAAVLGDGADLRTLVALAGVERERASAILDGLAGASILDPGPERHFAHPLLRTAVYEAIPPATRAETHARAARLLREQGAEPEAVAAHLLLCEPSGDPDALDVLDAAAARAEERSAPESVVTYLTRALPEVDDPARRGPILHRMGRAGVALRDPASFGYLQEATRLVDPALALEIYIELADALAMAGVWDAAVATIEEAFERYEGSELPGLLDLEAIRAAARGYDPATAALYAADEPRLAELVRGRTDDESSHLRWLLAGLGASRQMPREEVMELIGPRSQAWTIARRERESSLVFQAVMGVLFVDGIEEAEWIAAGLEEDARRRGSLMAMIGAVGYRASLDQRRGLLGSSEENVLLAIDLIRRNELTMMALTTFLNFCLDAIVERRGLDHLADLVESLELPPPFGETASGAFVLDVRAAVRLARGDRGGAVVTLREVEAIMRPLGFGPRMTPWRSRLALALPPAEHEEALALAREELEMARAVSSPRAEGVALRALGLLVGGEEGLALLADSVERLRLSPAGFEVARSLTELGAALGRVNRRKEARDRLYEAADLAQRAGAERLGERIEEEIRVAGGKPRRRAVYGPDSLTPSERRVAAAAAGGATNREIGQMLFVSMRTVEMHLTNAYRKLGISTRAELAEALEG